MTKITTAILKEIRNKRKNIKFSRSTQRTNIVRICKNIDTLSQECKDIASEQTKRLRNIEKVLVAIVDGLLGLSRSDLDLEE